jgi:hypothetical protein
MTTNEHQCDHIQLIDGVLVRCNRKATVEVESYDGDEDDVSIELFCDEHSPAHQAELWKEQPGSGQSARNSRGGRRSKPAKHTKNESSTEVLDSFNQRTP